MVLPPELFRQSEAHRLGVQPLRRQEQDAEIRCVRRVYVFVADIFRLAPDGISQHRLRLAHRRRVAGLVGIRQPPVGITGELGVDGQVHRLLAVSRQAHGVLHRVVGAFARADVLFVLIRRQHILHDGTQLYLAQDAARLDAGQHLPEVAHTARQRFHLTQPLIDLAQPVVHQLEGLRDALVQRLLQLFVHGGAHFFQLIVVLRPEGG